MFAENGKLLQPFFYSEALPGCYAERLDLETRMRGFELPRTFSRSLSVPAGVIAGLVAFALWMSIVGNPHVVETVLGLLVAAIVGTLLWWRMRSLTSKP